MKSHIFLKQCHFLGICGTSINIVHMLIMQNEAIILVLQLGHIRGVPQTRYLTQYDPSLPINLI